MKLLVDNQLPLALSNHLKTRGHDSVHVLQRQAATASDSEVWRLAIAEDRVLISKDEDFIFLANRTGDSGRLVWVRLGNCRNAALIAAFDRVHDDMVNALLSGQRIVEIQ